MKYSRNLFLFCIVLSIITTIYPMNELYPQEKVIPDYSLTERKDIPVEYTWKIEDLFASIEDWKKEKEAVSQLIFKIDEEKVNWTSSAKKMLSFLNLLNDIDLRASILYEYASHQSNTDISNTLFQSMKGELQSMFVQFNAKLSFFNTDVINLGIENFRKYLKEEPGLEPYRFRIEDIIRGKNHILPEDQQRIVSLTGLFSGVSSKAANMLNDSELPNIEITLSNGEKVVLNYANYIKYRSSKNPEDRSLVMREFWKNQKKYQNTFAILQDGAIKQHFFNAQVHNFNNCLEAKLFTDNIPVSVYEQLIESVNANLNVMHRYLLLKKQLLKLDKFRYEDIYASAVPTVEKLYTYEEAQEIIINSMKPLGEEYNNILKQAFTSRWIDVYPNKGKQSGAYSSGVYGVHPFIKMNYNGKYDAVSTLTHELGHALHSYLSDKNQHYATSQYPIFLAEIASTFNENLLMEYLLRYEDDDLFKLYVLDSYIDQVRGTLFRQTLFAEFELAMHKRVEEGKSLTSDWLNQKYLELTRKYYGHNEGVCYVDDYIEVEWSRIPHFYYNFYVYQYSTGIIASMALSNYVLNPPSDSRDLPREKYLSLLKSGGSDYPIELLKKAGVDMTKKSSYDAAFSRINYLLDQMEVIAKRLGLLN
ncbi:MAG: oligoendopeptidase F [Ignavibacteria bacterium]|nr:oligoendopeptidase F [Ignavibacteria bacterium]